MNPGFLPLICGLAIGFYWGARLGHHRDWWWL